MTQVQLLFIAISVALVLLMGAVGYGFYRFLRCPQIDETGHRTSQWDIIFGIDPHVNAALDDKTLNISHRDIGNIRTLIVGIFLFIAFLTAMFVYHFIGIPVKAPAFRIGQTEISVGRTTVKELLQEGYTLYLETTDIADTIHAECCRGLVILAPYNPQKETVTFTYKHEGTAENNDFALVKNGIVVCFVALYPEGGVTSFLECCAIKGVCMYQRNLSALRKANVDVSIDKVSLTRFHPKQFEATFNKRIYSHPFYSGNKQIVNQYSVTKSGPGAGLFWNYYNFSVEVNPTGTVVTGFNLDCRYRQDKEK